MIELGPRAGKNHTYRIIVSSWIKVTYLVWCYNQDERTVWRRGTEINAGISGLFFTVAGPFVPYRRALMVTWQEAGNGFQYFTTRRENAPLFVEDGFALAVFCRCVLSDQFGVGGGRNPMGWGQSTFENIEGQDDVSAFQCEEVELTKSFLIRHLAEASQ